MGLIKGRDLKPLGLAIALHDEMPVEFEFPDIKNRRTHEECLIAQED